jgi:EmrB/QacA subfamily drug resistance transporter
MLHFVLSVHVPRRSTIIVSDVVAVYPRRPLVLAACMMATFTAAVEITIVATAMPTIVADLHGAQLYSWVFSVYLLTQAVTIPIYGRLADLHGRKRVFIAGSVLFMVGSALCGLANSMTTLILFRALQGCGAGAVQPIAYTIVGDIYTPVERARIQGMLSGVFGAAAIVGPSVGAFLVEAGNWRYVFWVNLPISAAAIAMVFGFLQESRVPRRHRIDYMGTVLLVVAISAIIFAADRGRQIGWISVLITVTIGLASLLALLHHERRAAEPILPLGLWRSRVIAIGSLGGFTVGATIMSVTAFLPSYIQAAMGQSAAMAGIVLGIMTVIWTLGSVASGRLMVYVTYRKTACAGAACIIAGALILVTLTPLASIAHVALGASFVGIGLGFCNTTWVVSVQTQATYAQRGSATSAVLFTRFLGQAIGAAVAGIILSVTLQHRLPDVTDPLGRLLAGAASRQLAFAVADCFRGIFIMAVLLGLATLLLALQLPRGIGAGSPTGPAR